MYNNSYKKKILTRLTVKNIFLHGTFIKLLDIKLWYIDIQWL